MIKEDRVAGLKLADHIVKNTYRTLMTRGMKGCYVYCADGALATHLRSRLAVRQQAVVAAQLPEVPDAVPRRFGNLHLASSQDRQAGVPALPVVNVRIAAGAFFTFQSPEEAAEHWVATPDWITPKKGMFVAQVVHESTNPSIPAGAWCLFRVPPAAILDSKAVVLQHRHVAEPDTAGRFTADRYANRPSVDGNGNQSSVGSTTMKGSAQGEAEVLVKVEFLAVIPQ
jgi:hypothetical protein